MTQVASPRKADVGQQTVIITGASRGLGAAAARIVASMGANVVLNARSEDDLRQLATEIERSGGRAQVVPGDVSQVGDCRQVVERALEHFDGIDALINNAGILQPISSIADAHPEAWAGNIAVNLIGPFLLTHFALPHLRARQGRVVNVSSGAAVSVIEGWSAYCAAKAGLNHFTRVLAAEEPQITTIAVRPGVVDTAMQAAIRKEGKGGMPDDTHRRFMRYHQEGELLPPEAPGRALAALALRAPADWSGDFLSWDEDRVQFLVSLHT